MSHPATAWAWATARRLNRDEGARLNPGALLVLLALADYADEDHVTYPSRKKVAGMTGQSEKTVRRHTLELEARGLIARIAERRRRKDGSFAQDAWAMAVDGPVNPPQSEDVEDKIATRSRRRSPAVKMTAGPAVNLSGTSGHFVRPSIEEPVRSTGKKQKGAGERAEGAPAPDPGTLAGRLLVVRRFMDQTGRGAQATNWIAPLVADGEVLVVKDRTAWEHIRSQFSSEFRIGGIDIDMQPIRLADGTVLRAAAE